MVDSGNFYMYEGYKKLDLYKQAHQLVLLVYRLTKNFPKDELFGIVSQMRRAAVSIVANLVEGYGRKGLKEKIQFYHMALGSLNELEYYINLSFDLGYIAKEQYQELIALYLSTAKLFSGYLRGIQKKITSYQLPATSYHQSGQSLIETIVAIFILTTGLASGLALAIFAFGASSDLSTRIAATALAREGIEAARRTRDSNWLAGTLTDCGGGQQCYLNWLDSIPGVSGDGRYYRLNFNPQALGNKWTFEEAPATPSTNFYQLYRQAGGGLSHTVTSDSTNFFRKITIGYAQESAPYGPTSPLVLVRSAVWWQGKNCPAITNLLSPSSTSCKIITEEYLTNWKDY